MLLEHALGGGQGGDVGEEEIGRARHLLDTRLEVGLDARRRIVSRRGGFVAEAADPRQEAIDDEEKQLLLALRQRIQRAPRAAQPSGQLADADATDALAEKDFLERIERVVVAVWLPRSGFSPCHPQRPVVRAVPRVSKQYQEFTLHSPDDRYWNPQIEEQLGTPGMRELPLERLRIRIGQLFTHAPYFRARMEVEGLRGASDLRSLEDWPRAMPVFTKADFRSLMEACDNDVYRLLDDTLPVALDELVCMAATSGT